MATPEEILRTLDQQQLDAMLPADREQLDKLIASGMTQGLGINPRGQANLSGPVAGYAGPLRESDVPTAAAGADIPVYYGGRNGISISPGTMEARAEAGGPFRGILPDEQAQQVMKGISSMSAGGIPTGAQSKLVEGLMQSFGLGPNPYKDAFLKEKAKIAARGGVAGDDKAYNRALENLGIYYNKKTGAPATADFPDSSPSLEELRKNYVQLKTTDQRNDLSSLNNFDTDIAAYEELIKALPLAEKEGLISTGKSGLNIKYLRAANDPTVRQLDAIRARLVSTARGFGGTSKSVDSIRELERMEKAIVGDFDTKEGATKAIEELKRFRDSKAQALPIPGLHNRYAKAPGRPSGQQQQSKAPAAAEAYLKSHPEAAAQFKAKYGYLPNG